MPAATRTLPPANSVIEGTRQRVVNAAGDTTLTIVPDGTDWVAFPGQTFAILNPLASRDLESNGVDGWRITSGAVIPLPDRYTGAALTNISGTAQIVLSRATTAQPWSVSFWFTVSGGNLVAIRPAVITLEVQILWTPVTANNQDAGLTVDAVLRSGSGSVETFLYGGLFQSSRANNSPLGVSHALGYATLSEGDTIGLDANNYTGQSGQTDLGGVSLLIRAFG